MPRGFKLGVVMVFAAVSLFAVSAAFAHSTRAHVATTCSVGSGRNEGYTYVTSLSVKHIGCSNGLKVVKAHGKQKGWKCSQKRLATGVTQYQAQETCNKGSMQVVWKFSQNT